MLTRADIEQYRELKKQTDDANVEKQTMKAEIQVISNQGLERLKKYGLESYSDIPKLQKMIADLEAEVIEERDKMMEYCTYMANKKVEKATIFNKI